ncbi:MAG TPA: hypothetical protein VNI58_10420 [Mariprofundaceae bacterium]|nr:hypothetical protein [Mariprofundaceae bacterium]
MNRNRIAIPIVAAAALALAGCSGKADVPYTRGVYMLLDTSGTYTDELKKAQVIINYTLAKLNPGDTFAVARVDTGSFTEKNIIAKITFDDRPSVANTQKLKFRDEIDRFVKGVKPSAYTDISGGMLQAIEFLNEAHVGRKTILIFSDMKEDLKKGYVRDIPLQLNGFDVVALNVTKLRSDNIDPREYLDRLAMWQSRVEAGEGHWRVINDLERLEPVLGD